MTRNQRKSEMIEEFLAQKHIAIAGISRSNKPGNIIFKKFKNSGYQVYGIHPELHSLEGSDCYKNLADLPITPDGLFLITNPDLTYKLTKEAIILGVPRIWMHNLSGIKSNKHTPKNSSISLSAVDEAQTAGITVIAGSCPMQHIPPVDIFHRCIRWFNDKTDSA